jgi:cobalt/nickel transport protein
LIQEWRKKKEEKKMMRKVFFLAVTVFVLGFFANVTFAHFGMVIPSDTMVMQDENRDVKVVASFSHPFEGNGMVLEKPVRFGVLFRGKSRDLLPDLKETKVFGHKAWEVTCRINRPGVYSFYMEPKPYWESAEDKFIVHYTKTVISAFGDEEGWDQPVGLKTEIVPLTRPFGLYSGNVFQGIVLLNGKPAPYTEVEVEYYNKDGRAIAPTDYMVTQVVKADGNGVFTYAAPHAGWWGFAALNTAPEKMKHDGKDKDVEVGAVIWVKFQKWQER